MTTSNPAPTVCVPVEPTLADRLLDAAEHESFELADLLAEAAAALSVRDWLPIEAGGKLPAEGEWAIVLTDRESLGRADLNFLHPERPRFEVIPAQLRYVDDGWPVWQRWELASGHPCGLLEGDTHWQPLPAIPPSEG